MNINAGSSNYQRIHCQPAYILHTQAYQNTSLIVDAFTENFGRVRFVAKGAKRLKSSFAGKLQVFTPLLLSWMGKGDLYTLTDTDFASVNQISYVNGQLPLRGSVLLSAYYLNELILRFVTLEDPHPEVFYYYADALEKLSLKKNIETVLRVFEKRLLQETGYSLVLNHDIDTGKSIDVMKTYYYILNEGPQNKVMERELSDRLKPEYDGIYVDGKTLLELDSGSFTSKETLKQAKHLMRALIALHLGDKPLKTRALFQSTIL
ncbi:DNA recombination and repair protein RecO [hydrothermal vent metagenome]|uniref:DNA repair protein RecO n=1 Tax=hydrothermal vent metagenome TaxID=652676 RepID=A0A3B0ZZ19_9ZZZZ